MPKLTRRSFLIGSVALLGGGAAIGVALSGAPQFRRAAAALPDEPLLATWIKITPDNNITVIVPHVEMGQGAHTALAVMAAEELEADWDTVSVRQAPAVPAFANAPLGEGFLTHTMTIPDFLAPMVNHAFFHITKLMDLQITGGSTSVRFTGQYGMRVAGAAAREQLIRAAAKRWDVPAASLQAAASHVINPATGERLPFGALAGEAAKLKPSATPTLKAPQDFTLIGRSTPRLDVPAKVFGTAPFAIDVQFDGLHYAVFKRVPVHGAKLTGFEGQDAQNEPGVTHLLELEDGVAIVAKTYWQARKAAEKLTLRYEADPAVAISSAQHAEAVRAALDSEKPTKELDQGDVDAALSAAEKTVEAEYEVPYLAHAALEPLNATVKLGDDAQSLEVWTGTQSPLQAQAIAAETAGLARDQVTVHPVYLGGGFGRRIHEDNDYLRPAVEIAARAGVSVKLIYSREEDMAASTYRPYVMSRMRGGLDGQGNPVAFDHLYSEKHEPGEASVPPYSIETIRLRHIQAKGPLPFGPWRAVDSTQHAFFMEGFIDEMAVAAGADPLAFRLQLLRDKPHHRAVLEKAAAEAGYEQARAQGRPVGIALHESFGTIVAEIVEIAVEPGEAVRLVKVTCAVDCGQVVDPKNAEAQITGGVIFGLTAALFGEITVEEGRVVQANYPDYEMLRLGNSPPIEVHFIESDRHIGGLGEPSTPPAAPALVNALYAATGKRLRSLPLQKHGFRVA